MKYSENLFSTLEFDKIKSLLADGALTDGAKQMALLLEPSSDPVVIIRRQRRTADVNHKVYERYFVVCACYGVVVLCGEKLSPGFNKTDFFNRVGNPYVYVIPAESL